jgi:hypothetical protein
MRHDLEVATTKALKLKSAMENVWKHKASVPPDVDTHLTGCIKAFFGSYPEPDTDWSHNLWSGSFYPIIAFFGAYNIGEMNWGKPCFKRHVAEDLKLFNQGYGVTYVMASVYRKLGERALEALSTINRESLLDRASWDSIKNLQIPSFDTCESQKEIYDHVAELIRQDRVLRKVMATVIPPDTEPWKTSAPFFGNRPSQTSLLSPKYIRRLVRIYQPDLDDDAVRTISNLLEDAPTMTEAEKVEVRKMKVRLRATVNEADDYSLVNLVEAADDDASSRNLPFEDDQSRDEQEDNSFVTEDASTSDDDDDDDGDDGSHKLDQTKPDKPFKNRHDVEMEIQDQEDEEALMHDPDSAEAESVTSEVAAILGRMKQNEKSDEGFYSPVGVKRENDSPDDG